MTFTRVKACWDGGHSRREMETVGTDGFTRSPTGKQRNWVVAGKEFTGSRAFFSKGELVWVYMLMDLNGSGERN